MFTGATHPAADEIEIVVIGPGYGESIVIHIGQGEWIIVDSCTDRQGNVVAKQYLDFIGVAPDAVKYIVVSHWHDDHTRGISELATYYSSALIGVSSVLSSVEGKRFATAYSGKAGHLTKGTVELYNIFKDQKLRIQPLFHNTVVSAQNGKLIRALSPTPQCFLEARARLQAAIPDPARGSPLNEAPKFSPNNEAIALHMDAGNFAILLGSDLETNNHGWETLLAHPTCAQLRKADFYKVAHHGSKTAECAGIWAHLLSPSPISVLTPYNNGSSRLPNPADRQRIMAASLSFHTSSQATSRPVMDRNIVRRLSSLGTSPVPLNPGLGAVRARKNVADVSGAAGWVMNYFGAAAQLHA